MFNAKELNKKKEQIRQLEREIKQSFQYAKFHIRCDCFFANDNFKFELTDNTVVESWMYYDSEVRAYHSDCLIDAIMTCFYDGNIPNEINTIEFKIIESPDDHDYENSHNFNVYGLDSPFLFIAEYYDKLINHPEFNKLKMLIESLDLTNIELAKTILTGERD